ncbi:hypothetical protein RRG08_026291 [Elysia crispata]|uniref:Uncharacterized protein n=1 Tax=Elysia crispata TaxID=231223 RepID=A0AAE0ZBU6_9GAST|nr:hypothetical protein RRG08_026291 [Elysia crispata]
MLLWKSVLGTNILLFLPVTLSVSVERKVKPSPFCKRGFQVAGLYHECWKEATIAKPFEQLFETQEVYDGAFVEKYASHMCSKVKPLALRCLRKKVRNCTNSQKLISIADGSGGACTKNKLNPYFKLHITSKLKPVSRKSACFDVRKKSYSCHMEAGDKILGRGVKAEEIPHFHKVADKLFDYLWQCMIDKFKSNADMCPNWQLPMLLTLQRTAMPSLFGMRLNNHQIAQLELDKQPTDDVTNVDTGNIGCSTCKSDGKVYILIRVLSERPKKQDGDILLEMAHASNSSPKLDVINDDKDDVDVRDFLTDLMTGKNQV